jgi:hypothetical protein
MTELCTKRQWLSQVFPWMDWGKPQHSFKDRQSLVVNLTRYLLNWIQMCYHCANVQKKSLVLSTFSQSVIHKMGKIAVLVHFPNNHVIEPFEVFSVSTSKKTQYASIG